eukprot:TRINITY_DN24266_c0_g1_i8.p1 TRINITY_DN24266_c0_g1~~TRINITY_DN24266_c0_g1_i8.p1  ORF type:complete len:234 (+),score=3.67 TRINITY_DN24266_c0_g1_i8:74-775(+)
MATGRWASYGTGYGAKSVPAASVAVNPGREEILAFLMAYHPRLGARSEVQNIPKHLVVKIYSFIKRLPPALVTKQLDTYFRQQDPDAWDGIVQQIMTAAATGATTLDLDTMMLGSIPSCIGSCTELERLRLSGRGLVTLPAQIGYLTKLSSLTTYCCQVRFYPFELLNCTKLYVHGESLYIDLSSLLGRHGQRFPLIPSAVENVAQASLAGVDLAGVDAALCPWCRAAWLSFF